MGQRTVRTSSIAWWKARGRLPIRDNWTFFASSYGSDFISRYWSKSAFFKRGWVILSANFRWKGTSPTNLYGVRKLEWLFYHMLSKNSKYRQYVISFRHKARVWRTDGRTDRQTDRQNYDLQDCASIAVSRGKNYTTYVYATVIIICWKARIRGTVAKFLSLVSCSKQFIVLQRIVETTFYAIYLLNVKFYVRISLVVGFSYNVAWRSVTIIFIYSVPTNQ